MLLVVFNRGSGDVREAVTVTTWPTRPMRKSTGEMKSDFSMASILEGSHNSPTKPSRVSPCIDTSSPELQDEDIKVVDSHESTRVLLDEADLWRSFHQLTNEMIVTKNGR